MKSNWLEDLNFEFMQQVVGASGKTMYQFLKEQLNSCHRQQYSQKKNLKQVERMTQNLLTRCQTNGINVKDRGGAFYVPWAAAKYLHSQYRTISNINKKLNDRAKHIQYLQNLIDKLPKPPKIKVNYENKSGEITVQLQLAAAAVNYVITKEEV